jgi:hypothetical protein
LEFISYAYVPEAEVKTGILVLALVTTATLVAPRESHAQNSVAVESKTVFGGDDLCSLGVFVSNAIPITGIVIPLEIRSETYGAYIASGFVPDGLRWQLTPGNRVWASPLGVAMPGWPAAGMTISRHADTVEFFSACSGPISHTFGSPSAIDFISPDAVFFASVSTGDPGVGDQITLNPGSDPSGSANASFLIVTGIATQFGTVSVDTCCKTPGNHLAYVDENSAPVQPAFTAGTITVRCHHADPVCDGEHNIQDVVMVANRAYRGFEALNDPSCAAHGVSVDGLTDVNCDGITNIVDHVQMVNVAFRGMDPAAQFCDPCP